MVQTPKSGVPYHSTTEEAALILRHRLLASLSYTLHLGHEEALHFFGIPENRSLTYQNVKVRFMLKREVFNDEKRKRYGYGHINPGLWSLNIIIFAQALDRLALNMWTFNVRYIKIDMYMFHSK